LAGAFSVKEERLNLASATTSVVTAAKARVEAAARLGAKANGFEQGLQQVVIDVEYPPTSSYFAPYQNMIDYIGIRVRRPTPSSFANFFGIASFPVEATAVGRAGTDAAGNTCPGLYLFGKSGKTTDLKGPQGSKFIVHSGGIYINAEGNSLYGNASSELEAQWIETKNASTVQSVKYFCDAYPRPTGSTACVQAINQLRLAPELPSPSSCTSQNTNCCVKIRSSSPKLTELQCSGSTGTACVGSPVSTRTLNSLVTASPVLEAGTFCGGLTIENTGTAALPLKLQASTSSDTFIFANNTGTTANGNLTITSSYFTTKDANGSVGVTLYSLGGILTMDSSFTTDPNTRLRIYFAGIDLNRSNLEITPYLESNCGLLPAITTVVVQ
jgi:hypothetical protein